MTENGAKRFGDYELHRRLGVGGMAEVFEATRGHGKPVALKRLLPQLRRDETIVTSFIDEAQICAELSHPNVVAVYDFGEAEDTYYMTMELLDGPDLQQLLTRLRNQARTLPLSAVAYIGYQLALGLHYIHTHPRAIVHRDVTPHNVFLTRDGAVKLADFGVAFAKERLTQTKTGFVKGKLSYLSPEQVRGDPVTPRTDVFAAGLLLFEMITGERANQGDADLKLIEWAMNPQCPPPSSMIPSAKPLDRVVAQAVQRSAALRTRDASLLADQLEELLRRKPFAAPDLARLIADVGQAEKGRRERREARREARREEAEERRTQSLHDQPTQAAKGQVDALDSVEITQPRHELRGSVREAAEPTGSIDEGAPTFALGPEEAEQLRQAELETTFYVSKERKSRPPIDDDDRELEDDSDSDAERSLSVEDHDRELELAQTQYVGGQPETIASRKRSRSLAPPRTGPVQRVDPEDYNDGFVSEAPTMERSIARPLQHVKTSQLPSLPPPPPPLVSGVKRAPPWLPWLLVGVTVGIALIVATVVVVF